MLYTPLRYSHFGPPKARPGRGTEGFRESIPCTDHLNTLGIIVEQTLEFQSLLYLFVNFEKTFDNLQSSSM